MKKKNESFWLAAMPKPEGCGFHLLDIGRLRTTGSHVFEFGGYNCWHIVSRGQGYVRCGGKVFPLKRGDLFSVMYGNRIEYGPAPGTDWEFYYLRIEGREAAALSAKIGLREQAPVVRFPWKEEVLSMFRLLWGAAESNDRSPEFFAAGILQIVDRLTRGPHQKKVSDAVIVGEARRIMEDPMYPAINVNELADSLRISRVRLFHAFKSVTGRSPLHELQKFRIKTCSRLLREAPELSLSQIAGRTAFRNEKYFIRVFREYTGMTPGQFRKSIRSVRNHSDIST